ncbi:MAG: NAD(P)H-dependent oxidoreductase subunit E [Syntrophales bacterium]
MSTLDPILKGRRSQPHQLIEVLQDVQETHGYISEEAMKTVAKELGVPVIEVLRVASFYKAFSLQPRGKNVITICTGTACHVRGSNLLIDQVKGQLKIKPGETTKDGLFTVECVNCVGACALGPVVVQNGSYNHHVTPGKLRKIIEKSRGTRKEEAANAKTQKIR